MVSLQERLASILGEVFAVEEEPDGALTIRHDGTFASLRVVNIVEDLDLVSLTQILVWDLPLTKKISDQVAEKAAQRNSGKGAATAPSKTVDVMLRYNFPGAGLTDDALRTLILLVLDTGAEIRHVLTS